MAVTKKEEQQLNIYQKLAKIRKNVEVLQKNKEGYGYKYVDEALILEKITGLMDKYELSLIPNIVPGTMKVDPYSYSETKTLKTGGTYEKKTNEVIVSAELQYVWHDNVSGEEIIVPWIIVGQQADASQAFGSGLSYASRYMLLKFFSIATTEDDPDNWRSRQKEAAQSEEREVAKAIVARIHTKVTAFVAEHPDQRDGIVADIKAISVDKNGKPTENYMKIEDPAVAAKLWKKLDEDFFHETGDGDAA